MQLFLYGVLREGVGTWPFLAGIGPGRMATASGALFAIADPAGWYPAMRQGQGPGWSGITGTLHDASNVDLSAVDAFEGADYARRPVPVCCEGETIMADAYLWAGPLPAGATPIAHGDFVRWLAETGHAPFAGD